VEFNMRFTKTGRPQPLGTSPNESNYVAPVPRRRAAGRALPAPTVENRFSGDSVFLRGRRLRTSIGSIRRPPAPQTRERTPGGSGTGHPATPLSKFRSVDQRLDCGCCDLFHQLRTCSRGGTRPAQTVYSYPWCGPSPSRVGAGRDRGFNRGGSEREHKSGSPCIRSRTIKVDDRLTSFGGYGNRLTNLN
jgi:hypothetical protein